MTLTGGPNAEGYDWLSDATFKLERARRRYRELNRSLVGLWHVSSVGRQADGNHRYALVLRQEALGRIRGLAGDIACELMHTLDYLVSARAWRSRNELRSHGFPVSGDDEVFDKSIRKLAIPTDRNGYGLTAFDTAFRYVDDMLAGCRELPQILPQQGES